MKDLIHIVRENPMLPYHFSHRMYQLARDKDVTNFLLRRIIKTILFLLHEAYGGNLDLDSP
jgi:hypothetical protein